MGRMECCSTVNLTSRAKAQITENSYKNLLNTSSDVLLFTTLLKRGPADGNLAILDDICQQVPPVKTYLRYCNNSPERMEKYQTLTSYHLKNFGKTPVLGKRLLPESNRSLRQTPDN